MIPPPYDYNQEFLNYVINQTYFPPLYPQKNILVHTEREQLWMAVLTGNS